MEINTNNIFETKISTRTFILKPVKEEDNEFKVAILPDSYTNKLRNCVIKKILNKCIKLYSNGSIQLNGINNINILQEIILKSGIENLNNKYVVQCILNNWTLNFNPDSSKIINLVETMKNLNNNGIIAYFQKGYPLIIKCEKSTVVNKYYYHHYKNNKIENILPEEKIVKITFMLFKSGKSICTIGGDVTELPIDIFEKIQNYILYI